jgi:pyridoxal phosphate enzyme (YggS family)
MRADQNKYVEIVKQLSAYQASLVAVSKTKPVEAIRELYEIGQRDFGENYVQELLEKQGKLPADIRWHFIGHLQSNKVKYIASFIYLIHGIDSLSLLKEVNKQAAKHGRVIDVLLQVHIAKEETKFGFSEEELEPLFSSDSPLKVMENIRIRGLMGMASFTDDSLVIRNEFRFLHQLFQRYKTNYTSPSGQLDILSMGMSGDYAIALEEGSNMVRIGSLIFGSRDAN